MNYLEDLKSDLEYTRNKPEAAEDDGAVSLLRKTIRTLEKEIKEAERDKTGGSRDYLEGLRADLKCAQNKLERAEASTAWLGKTLHIPEGKIEEAEHDKE